MLGTREGRRGCAACISRGRAHDRHTPSCFAEHKIIQLTNQLHGDILEGEGRAVMQFQEPAART